MKNILILNHHVTPNLESNHRHIQLAKDLEKNFSKVTIIGSTYNGRKDKYRREGSVVEEQLSTNIKYVGLESRPRYGKVRAGSNILRFLNYLDFQYKLNTYLKHEDTDYDVVIASSVHPFVWKPGWKTAKKNNAQFIVEVRDLWPLSFYEDLTGLTRKLTFLFFERMEKKYYKLADKIVVTAPFASEYMNEKFSIPRSKVFHIPHSIDMKQYFKLQKEYNVPKHIEQILNKYEFNVVYLGSLSKSEGLETLIYSARELSKINNKIGITIIGNGSERKKLENLKDSYGLENLNICKGVDYKFVPSILKRADVLYTGLTNKKAFEYGISKNKFYDYMASRTPVIFSSNVRGSLIDEAQCGFTVPAGDYEQVAESIVKMYLLPKQARKNMGYKGYKYAKKHHERQVISRKFIELMSKGVNHVN